MADHLTDSNDLADEPSTSFWRRLQWRHLRWFMAGSGALLAVYLITLVVLSPSVDHVGEAQTYRASVILAADGSELGRFQKQQQKNVTLEEVSPAVVKALIATEDHRFHQHHGVDLLRTVKAVMRTVQGDTEGGSTLTQQLARNFFPEKIGRDRTAHRKVKEIITALRIESRYSKKQILEAYLNTAPFLYNVVGIEMAAQTYYDKSAADLDVLQSATLVGMLKGTRYYNPVIYPERARKRRNLVMSQMVRRGELSQAEFDQLKKKPLQLKFNRQSEDLGIAPHFTAHVRKWLFDWAEKNEYDPYRDGLVVHTTLDPKMQKAAVEAVERQTSDLQAIADVEWSRASLVSAGGSPKAYARMRDGVEPFAYFWRRRPGLLVSFIKSTPEYKKAVDAGIPSAQALAELRADKAFMKKLRASKTSLAAGFVAIDPHSSEIKAWVGSTNFEEDQFDHVAQAQRQPGSTFKPVVYGAALEMGIPPDRRYLDTPLELRMPDGKIWRPTDMSGSTGQALTMWEGLVYSKNTITARVMQEVGLPRVTQLARAMGIRDSQLDEVPSMALGTSPVTLLEMATLYATIAREGEYRPPVFLTRITDREGQVLEAFPPSRGERVMSRETALDLIEMLRHAVTRGTGTMVRTRFGVDSDVAGKTGTTQNNADGWFMLMHPDLVVGAWVGFNDQRVTMRSSYWGQGGHNALLLVGDFVKASLDARTLDGKAMFAKALRPAVTFTSYASGEDPEYFTEGSPGVEDLCDRLAGDPGSVTADPAGMNERAEIVCAQAAQDAADMAEGEAPKSDAELGQIMLNMGRDASTGAPLSSVPDMVSTGQVAPAPEAPLVIQRVPGTSSSGAPPASADNLDSP